MFGPKSVDDLKAIHKAFEDTLGKAPYWTGYAKLNTIVHDDDECIPLDTEEFRSIKDHSLMPEGIWAETG